MPSRHLSTLLFFCAAGLPAATVWAASTGERAPAAAMAPAGDAAPAGGTAVGSARAPHSPAPARPAPGGVPSTSFTEAAELRLLPTVVKVWGRKMSAERIVMRPPALYVKSGGQLTALSLRSGRQLWSRHLGEGSCCGDDLVVTDSTVIAAADDKLFCLNAADGSTRGELDLGGIVSPLVGPPVVTLLAGSNELLAVDPDSCQVTGRVPLDGEVEDLAVAGSYVLANLAAVDEERRITAGYSADTLRPLWRIETRATLPQIERRGDRLFLERWRGGKEGHGELLPIDPATGGLGTALPSRAGKGGGDAWPWEIESLPGESEMRERLRRHEPDGGKARWTTELPCRVQGLARSEGTLYASCGRGGGRGLLAALAWAGGEIQQLAFGLPRGHSFLVGGGLAVVAAEGEVAAYSLHEVGPPEAGRPVEDEVRRILLDSRGDDAPLDRGQWIDDRLQELAPLGPAAYPAIARLLPQLGPTSLVAAANALSGGGQRAAAPTLARLLAGALETPRAGPGWEGWNPQFALLRALAHLGGDAEVPALAALLDRRDRPGKLRREVLATLVALRSPAGDAAVRAWLARPEARRRRPLWSPPAPPAGSPSTELPDGRRLVLFRHGYLGSPDDLWVAEVARDGRLAGPSRFTGIVLPVAVPEEAAEAREDAELAPKNASALEGGTAMGGEASTSRGDASKLAGIASPPPVAGSTPRDDPSPPPRSASPVRARVAGDLVEVIDGAGRRVASFSLAETARDGDGDGVPDLAERRLRLDPARADTDGDGLPDGDDPAPNARLRRPLNDEQEIAAAIFRQYFQFEQGPGPFSPAAEVAVVVSDFALEWRGRPGLTITLDEREAERFRAETGGGGVPMLTIRPGEPPTVTPVSGDAPPAAAAPVSARDEEVFTVTVDRGALHAVTYRAVVRNLDAAQPGAPRLWALRSLRPVWIG